jgi:xanthosine utilization system XapX-like protein
MSDAPVPIEARIVDFKMPFWSMVGFLVKVSIAAIPAIIILSIIGFLIFAALAGIGASMMHRDPTPIAATPSAAGEKQDEAPSTPKSPVSEARSAAINRCEIAFAAGDAQQRCITRESDCVREYGEHVDPENAGAQIACFNAVQR